MPRPLGGRVYAAELSAARKQAEDARTATWKISYYQRFTGPAGAGSRWFRMQGHGPAATLTRPRGCTVARTCDEDGTVSYVSHRGRGQPGQARHQPQDQDGDPHPPGRVVVPPRGPFERYLELMQREDLRAARRRRTSRAGRRTASDTNSATACLASIAASISGSMPRPSDWSGASSPGGDLFDAAEIVRDRAWALSSGETIEYEGKVFKLRTARAGSTRATSSSEIAFDVELDDALSRSSRPRDTPSRPRSRPRSPRRMCSSSWASSPTTTTRRFPIGCPSSPRARRRSLERLTRAQQAVHQKSGASPAEVKLVEAMDRWWQTGIPGPGPMHVFITQQIAEGSWKYLGKGVKLGDKDRIVCWYRPKGSRTYRVVYGDLSVKDVEPEDLPLPVGR